jgi:hypothetical protein
LRARVELDLAGPGEQWLIDGWSSRTTDPFGALRWIEGTRAEIMLPLDLPDGAAVRVAWSARTRRLDFAAPVTLALIINGRETYRFTPDTEQSSHFAFTVPPDEGLLHRGFNRIVLERRTGEAPVAVYRVIIEPLTDHVP